MRLCGCASIAAPNDGKLRKEKDVLARAGCKTATQIPMDAPLPLVRLLPYNRYQPHHSTTTTTTTSRHTHTHTTQALNSCALLFVRWLVFRPLPLLYPVRLPLVSRFSPVFIGANTQTRPSDWHKTITSLTTFFLEWSVFSPSADRPSRTDRQTDTTVRQTDRHICWSSLLSDGY